MPQAQGPNSPRISLTGEDPPPPPVPPAGQGFQPGNSAFQGLPEVLNDRALLAIAMRLDGYTNKEISANLGLSEDQVRYALRKARATQRLADVVGLLDTRAVPQAVENLIEALESPEREGVVGERWWEATKKTLDGRGAFRKFNDKNQTPAGGAQLPPLQINIITPDGRPMPTVIVNSDQGSVVGEGRADAEEQEQETT